MQTQRCAEKRKTLSQPVFQITLVGKVDQVRIVDKDGKGRRRDTDLSCVVNAQRATALDAAREGFATRLLTDLCAGVAPETTSAALAEMVEAGVEIA